MAGFDNPTAADRMKQREGFFFFFLLIFWHFLTSPEIPKYLCSLADDAIGLNNLIFFMKIKPKRKIMANTY